MKRVGIVIIVFALCMVLPIHAESFSLDEILEDIYNQLSEDGEVPMEDIQEELMEIAENPIDLNHTTANELSRLYFLSDEQIDAILLYQYKHPFNDIYELQLIDCLKDYEIRNLLPFVEVEAKGERLEDPDIEILKEKRLLLANKASSSLFSQNRIFNNRKNNVNDCLYLMMEF